MLESIIQHFSATPWCRDLIESGEWVPTTAGSQQSKPMGEDSFISETLSTSRTIRWMLVLHPTKELSSAADTFGDMVYGELCVIFEIGDGVSGHPRIAHGGFISTITDEAMGILVMSNSEAMVKKKEQSGLPGPHEPLTCFTAYLNTTYAKPLPAPGLVLCRVKLDRVVRSRIYVSATLEDGNGTVFSRAESMFVSVSIEKRDAML